MILFLCSLNILFHRESTDDGLQTEMRTTNKSEQVLTVMNYNKVQNIIMCRVVHVMRMMGSSSDGFISTLVTISLNYSQYRQYSTIPDLHIFQFTTAHELESPVFTSHLLATDLNIGTITVSLDYTLQVKVVPVLNELSTTP
jgi:hypothetical protein